MEWERQKAYEYKRGKAEGEQEKALEAARNFLKKRIDPGIIAECTGLPLETVQNLADELVKELAAVNA